MALPLFSTPVTLISVLLPMNVWTFIYILPSCLIFFFDVYIHTVLAIVYNDSSFYFFHVVMSQIFGSYFHSMASVYKGLLCGSDGKESACNAGDLHSIPGLGRSPEEGKGYPLQYSCLENSMDREAWLVTVCGASKSQT